MALEKITVTYNQHARYPLPEKATHVVIQLSSGNTYSLWRTYTLPQDNKLMIDDIGIGVPLLIVPMERAIRQFDFIRTEIADIVTQ